MHALSLYLLHHLGIFGLSLLIVVENMGVPLPTELAYVGAQSMVNTGQITYLAAFIVLSLAHILGACISYWIGRRIELTANPKGRFARITKEVAEWYARYGSYATFFSRFIGQVRPWSSYVAGLAEEPFPAFLLWTSLGTLIFNALAMAFTGTIVHLWRVYPLAQFAIILITLSGLVWIFYKITKK